ncbi:MAG: hypothetical protein ACOY94_05970 [Bacillota bacterium]
MLTWLTYGGTLLLAVWVTWIARPHLRSNTAIPFVVELYIKHPLTYLGLMLLWRFLVGYAEEPIISFVRATNPAVVPQLEALIDWSGPIVAVVVLADNIRGLVVKGGTRESFGRKVAGK